MPSPARPVAYVADPGGLVFRNVYSRYEVAQAILAPNFAVSTQGVEARLHELRRLGVTLPSCLTPGRDDLLHSHSSHPFALDYVACLETALEGHPARLEGRIVPSVLARRPDLWATADARIEHVGWSSTPHLGKGYTKVVTFA